VQDLEASTLTLLFALKYARRIALLPRRTMEGIVRFVTDSAKLTMQEPSVRWPRSQTKPASLAPRVPA